MAELKKILYAEDEPDVQTVVELTVQTMSDYEIKICDNGKILLDCVRDYNPDLILLDVMMPEMDGTTTFKHLQENEDTKRYPVIFMTAKAQLHEVEQFKEMGAIGIITKPFNPITLCDEIKSIWETI
jgi:CheY-like chemotaxis protein